jgi:hypothetical protein
MATQRFRQADLDEVETIAWLLDNSIPIPGTGRRVGVDSIIGFVPGLGDLLSGLIGVAVVARGAALGLPRIVVARMLFNVAVDFVIGAIPVAGDAFDLWFKSNARNVALMRQFLGDRDRSTASQWTFFTAILAGLAVLAVAFVWMIAQLVGELVRLL